MSGWVYIVTNKALPGLVKVGYTTRVDINQRLREFNQAGTPYEKAYALWVEEPRLIEQRVHQALPAHREYPGWFRCSVERARETIKKIAGPEAETETDRRIAEARARAAGFREEVEADEKRDRDFVIEIDLRGRDLPPRWGLGHGKDVRIMGSRRSGNWNGGDWNGGARPPDGLWDFWIYIFIFLACILIGGAC